MNTDLKTVWEEIANESDGVVSQELAHEHLANLEKYDGNVEPVVHCVMAYGLLENAYAHPDEVNQQVMRLLERLEAAQRKIVMIQTTFGRALNEMRRVAPGKDWGSIQRLSTFNEFYSRAKGVESPKAELIITPYPKKQLSIDHKAHVTAFHPLHLK